MPKKLRSIGNLVISREIRDPIYNYIHLTDVENKILDSRVFQRLDGLAQMPTAHLVYPSGKYSRKTHSLGAMHLMSKAILHILYLHSEELRREISPLLFGESIVFREDRDVGLDHLDQKINNWWNSKELDEIIQYSRLAALLHDIGHAPFSHTFEDVVRDLVRNKTIKQEFDHEKMSRKIITARESELGLGENFKGKEINDILDKKGRAPDFLKELISGPCDCDKLDYLMRDSYHMGAPEYGNIDAERIIDGLRVKDQRLCISSSALHAMMNSFRAIQSMYTAVYYHRASRVFDFMIADALCKVPEFIAEIISSIDEFLKYDDCTIVYAIRERAQGEDSSKNEYKEAKIILEKVRNREKMYKCILEFPLVFPIATKKDVQTDLKESCKKIEACCERHGAEGFNVRLDYRPAIRPVGIEPEEVIDWLGSPRIYDTEDGQVKSLKEIYKTYFLDLLRYSVLFRIFVDREKYKTNFDTVNKIKKEAKEELERVDSKWMTFLSR